jgi:hypothetical protein
LRIGILKADEIAALTTTLDFGYGARPFHRRVG